MRLHFNKKLAFFLQFLSFTTFFFVFTAFVPVADAVSTIHSETTQVFMLADSTGAGAFNLPNATAFLSRGNETEEKLFILDFEIPEGSAAGAWFNGFADRVNKNYIDEIFFQGKYFKQKGDFENVQLFLELKGSKGIQKVKISAISLSSEDFILIQDRILIDWNAVGTLKELTIVLSPLGNETISGSIKFKADFKKLSFIEKSFAVFLGRIFACFLFAVILASLSWLFGKTIKRCYCPEHIFSSGILSSFFKDVLLGIALVILFLTILFSHSLGFVSPFIMVRGAFLAVALLCFFISLLAKFYFTGKMLSPLEVFTDIFCCGILVCGVSGAEIWEAPLSFSDFFKLSAFGGTFFLFAYHIANFYRLSTSKKHISVLVSFCIALCPYFFGTLFALQNAALLFPIKLINISALPALNNFINNISGIFALLLFFNIVAINVASLLADGRLSFGIKKYLCLFLVSFYAAVSPFIADLGSGIIPVPSGLSSILSILAVIFSQGGLWAEVFLITGIVLEAAKAKIPSADDMFKLSYEGFKKGAYFSGILMIILQIIGFGLESEQVCNLFKSFYAFLVPIVCAISFPLFKTIIETFDGSVSFFARLGCAFRKPVLYARGFVAGIFISLGITFSIGSAPTNERILFGFLAGIASYTAVSFFRDLIYKLNKSGELANWRYYVIEVALGGFVGAGLAFYFDTQQINAIIEKLLLYKSFGSQAVSDSFYPLLSKWGKVELSPYCGGAKLLYNESLKGVIGWGVAAWLFAINKAFLAAIFEKNFFHVSRMTKREGISELADGTVHVLRWGLWMAPIIFTFLKQMHEPTWYNQDGAIRSIFAIWNNLTMSPANFAKWSLTVFMWVLAYDFFRILIWLDHMGLRVATLVNLSFIGMDRFDAILARITGSRTSVRFIPEGIKRFTTWAPLLIPFYIPAGNDWNWAWNTSEAIQKTNSQPLFFRLLNLPISINITILILSIFICAMSIYLTRILREKFKPVEIKKFRIANRKYAVEMMENFSKCSWERSSGFDLFRRSYDYLDPCGTALFICEIRSNGKTEFFPLFGNVEYKDKKSERIIEGDETHICLTAKWNDLHISTTITLLSEDEAIEKWELKIENLSESNREFYIVPYLEWNLNSPEADRNHTQFNRLFHEISYYSNLDCIIAKHRMTQKIGFLASSQKSAGFLNSRMDFIGRAGTLSNPFALQELYFHPDIDAEPAPSFDPAGALFIPLNLISGKTEHIEFIAGFEQNLNSVIETVGFRLGKGNAKTLQKKGVIIKPGHGKPPSLKPNYCEFRNNGSILAVFTPFTPRPFDHSLVNSKGQATTVTNRGLHTTSNVNSQQNQITVNWADTVTNENPAEAIYIYDTDTSKWFSPTYLPLRDNETEYYCEFSLFGNAKFKASNDFFDSELVVFVPPDDPVTVYNLSLKNKSGKIKRLRISPFFRIVLADKPGNFVKVFFREEKSLDALLFSNPNNRFRKGTAFAGTSEPVKAFATKAGAFFGDKANVACPQMLEKGYSVNCGYDKAPMAALLCEIEISPNEEKTINFVLGQTDTRTQALDLIKKYKVSKNVSSEMSKTEDFWRSFALSAGNSKTTKLQDETMSVSCARSAIRMPNSGKINVEGHACMTEINSFDICSPEKNTNASLQDSSYMNWLKYQTLAERIWARRGFYQSSGAFGFRDQLQDSINLAFFKPEIAKQQILINTAQQFIEGDVAHWFFLDENGKTGLISRSYASDNLLWLVWACVEYIRITGDKSILDCQVYYLETETPLAKLPKGKHGMCFVPLRSPKKESVFKHLLRAVNLVLEKKLGKNGLPLIGTGDWNDGFDEIGSQGRGESVWLAFFLFYCLKNLLPITEEKLGKRRYKGYLHKLEDLRIAIEKTWRTDRYLRAIHDDGTEIGVKDSGIWEIDAINAAWAVISGVNSERAKIFFDTAISVLEKEKVILLGWPPLNEETKPYLGRSCKYPEGVRENGMYCHGVQWLVGAARIIAKEYQAKNLLQEAQKYEEIAGRLWKKISSIGHFDDIENFGGQPNKQSADMLTKFAEGRMIWNGYTGAAGWMLRQAVR